MCVNTWSPSQLRDFIVAFSSEDAAEELVECPCLILVLSSHTGFSFKVCHLNLTFNLLLLVNKVVKGFRVLFGFLGNFHFEVPLGLSGLPSGLVSESDIFSIVIFIGCSLIVLKCCLFLPDLQGPSLSSKFS